MAALSAKKIQGSSKSIDSPSDLKLRSCSNSSAIFRKVSSSDATLTPKCHLKFAELMASVNPQNIQSKCYNVNISQPPQVHLTNHRSGTLVTRNNSKNSIKLPVMKGTPKGSSRTPRNTCAPQTPIDDDLNTDGGSRSGSVLLRRDIGSKFRMSLEEASTPRLTGSHSSSTSGTPITSVRRSSGSAQKNVRSTFQRSQSVRKSASHYVGVNAPYASPFTNPPLNIRKRLSYQGTWGTPLVHSDLYCLRKADIQNGVLGLEESEAARENESSQVSVVVRVRPFNDRERNNAKISNILLVDGNKIAVHCENGTINSFYYDTCLLSHEPTHPNHASQEQVYNCAAKPLLVHVYEGYNVCLFAYGQTGSGKSYCIMGENNPDIVGDGAPLCKSVGIIPRFCRDLFKEADLIHSRNSEQDGKCQVVVEISYIEIYNEKIYDLVSWQNPTCGDVQKTPSSSLSGEKRDALRIREHPVNGPHIVGAACHLVSCAQDLETWINLGNKQRSIAATGMNDKSSRSHSVFSVKVTQTQVETIEGEEMEHSLASLINIVDLAGSERVGTSQSEGERLKEGVYINKSLLTLGKVITALAESDEKRKVFIPYRESTLTWLLKESLGGNSKTTMIATVSPCSIHQEETLSTLRYAQQARKIVNWNWINEDPTSKIIRALKLEVERLRSLQLSSPRQIASESKNDESLEESDQEREVLREAKEEKAIIHAKEREISILKEKLRATQEQFTERARLWERKLLEAEVRKKEALERCRMKGLALKIEDNEPILIHLCEDPQLSQSLLYNLKKGSTTLGPSNADVTLSGLHDTDTHCSIFYEEDRLVLHPQNEAETYINGKLVSSPTEIFHNDRIVLAGIYFFRVCFRSTPEEKGCGRESRENKFDFRFARDELLKEQEERIRQEMSAQQAAARADMLKKLEEQKHQFEQQEMLLKDNVKSLSTELEEERSLNLEIEMARLLLEEEKRHLESQVKALKQFDDQVSLNDDVFSPAPRSSFFEEMEAIFNDPVQIAETKSPTFTSTDVEVYFLVAEANGICTKLLKSYQFQPQTRLTSCGGSEMIILVRDLDHDLVAFLNMDKLKQIINILKDLKSGEQDDDTVLDSIIPWERHEGSQFTLVHKIRENSQRLSLNQSLNSSILNSSLRRLSLRGGVNQSNLRNGSLSSPNPSAILAKGVSQALLRFMSPVRHDSLFADVLSHLIKLDGIVKIFRNHCQETRLSAEHLNDRILQLALLSPSVDTSLSRLGSFPFQETREEVVVDLQNKIATVGSKFIRKVARMLQGVENEVGSLIDEESLDIRNLIHELVEDIGFLNLVVSYEMPQGSFLVSSLSICSKYLIGVSKGLEWKVNKASTWAENTSSLIASTIENTSCPAFTLRTRAIKAVRETTAFLSQFSQLKVEPNVDETMPLKKTTAETCRFLGRIAAAAENVQSLINALSSIVLEFESIDAGKIRLDVLGEAVLKLHESLSELVDDAGIGVAFEWKRERGTHSVSSNSVEAFLESLHSQALRTFKKIKAFRTSIEEMDRVEQARLAKCPPAPPQGEGEVPHPFKSAIKGSVRSCEKKVRFNINLSSSSVGSFLEYKNEDLEKSFDV